MANEADEFWSRSIRLIDERRRSQGADPSDYELKTAESTSGLEFFEKVADVLKRKDRLTEENPTETYTVEVI